jgi:imidazolonepropionase-like amidohydrolase
LARSLTTDAIIDAYRSEEMLQWRREAIARGSNRTSTILASTKAMADAGVTILTGTDSGNFGTIQGYSLHRELIKLVAAGLTPWQALAASTTKAGEFLGRSWGVRPGDEANLVVLEASPIDDIRNTQRIAMVIQRGQVVDREQLLAGESR